MLLAGEQLIELIQTLIATQKRDQITRQYDLIRSRGDVRHHSARDQ
jgi:hypothetical protein